MEYGEESVPSPTPSNIPSPSSSSSSSSSINIRPSPSDSESEHEPQAVSPMPGYVFHDDPTYHSGPPTCTGRFCQLPMELQDMIASRCSQHTLAVLARTCILMHKVATEALYRSIVIKTEDENLSMSLLNRSTGADWRNTMFSKTQSFEALLAWSSGYEYDEYNYADLKLADISIVNRMTSLVRLKLIWDDYGDDDDSHFMKMPTKLAATLTHCHVEFTTQPPWSLVSAIPLFKHENLQVLDLYRAGGESDPDMSSLVIGRHVTALHTLNLVECEFSPSNLSWMLSFPMKLRYLSIGVDTDTTYTVGNEVPEDSGYFRAIVDSHQPLTGLRIDMSYRRLAQIPAPGMHGLQSVRYLEAGGDHIGRLDFDDSSVLPDVHCPLEQVLPPNLEVLKIIHNPHDGILWEILTRRKADPDYLPHLRRIFIEYDYRDQASSDALKELGRKRPLSRNWKRTWGGSYDSQNWPISGDKDPLTRLKLFARLMNIEIVQLYRDRAWQELLKEPAMPPVWEIPEQIAALSEEALAAFAAFQQNVLDIDETDRDYGSTDESDIDASESDHAESAQAVRQDEDSGCQDTAEGGPSDEER